MPEFAKTNNHADKTQVPDANHSEVELPSNTFASTKMNLPTDSLHNKVNLFFEKEIHIELNGMMICLVTPSPCRNIDGAIPLGISDKGFVMCDGERMFVESCPGGTIWDDSVKACVWPDMIGLNTVTPALDQVPVSSGYSYNKPEPVPAPVPLPRPVLDTPMVSSYGSQPLPKPTFTQPIQNDFRSFKHSAY